MKRSFFGIIAFVLLFAVSAFAYAQEPDPFHSSPYPLPRFVSLGSGEVNVRTGPGPKYPIKWVYTALNLPVEVVLEYENWRKIKDKDGDEGWVHSNLLSGTRTGIIKSNQNIIVLSKPDTSSKKLLEVEPQLLVFIKECEGGWCKISTSGYSGWIERKFIWGVYENENFD